VHFTYPQFLIFIIMIKWVCLHEPATVRNKGVKGWVKTNNDSNFWVYSTLQNKVSSKIIFRKLEDTVCVRPVGVPLWGANMAAIKVSTRNEAANDIITFLVSLDTYWDDSFTLLQYLKIADCTRLHSSCWTIKILLRLHEEFTDWSGQDNILKQSVYKAFPKKEDYYSK